MQDILFAAVMMLVIPAIMLGFGYRFSHKLPDRAKTTGFAYRTARATRSQESWELAHKLCGRIWSWLGAVLLAVSLAAIALTAGQGADAMTKVGGVLTAAQTIILVISVVPVERTLKDKFD